MTLTREPAVAGAFYPADADDLRSAIKESYLHPLGPGTLQPSEPQKIYGMICPHAGYMYSGPVACHSFHAVSGGKYDTFTIVGPNHLGRGRSVAVPVDCSWKTPLGVVEVDSPTARSLAASSAAEIDFASHIWEHSIEVQIPMIQHAFGDIKILPVAMIDQSKEASINLGHAIAELAGSKSMMIIGSSDLTHYEPATRAYTQDMSLIKSVVSLDVDGFYETLTGMGVSACGYGAMATVMTACQDLGATGGRMLKYATSGHITGDMDSVVGYCSVVFV